MKTRFKGWMLRVVAGASALFLSATAAADNIVETLSARPEFSTLVTAVTQAGLADDLATLDDLTVFAPDNDAFAKVPAEVLDGLLADPEALTELLFYHVVPERIGFRHFRDGSLDTLLSDKPVDIEVRSFLFGLFRIVEVDEARVVHPDIVADNGVIHRINSVLDPAFMTKPSILEIAAGNPDFSILAGLVEEAGLSRVLASEFRTLTVFAPNNAAFEALGEETLEAVANDRAQLRAILKNHIAFGALDSGTLDQQGEVRTVLPRTLPIEPDGSSPTGLSVDGVPLLAADLHASNGLVHVVESVLLPAPPETLVDVAAGRDDLSTFVDVVTLAGLADTFNQVERFPAYTIFAPNNDAFAAVPAEVLESLLADPTGALADVLKLHVVHGRLGSEDLYDGQVLESLSGERLNVAISGGEVRINGALVAETDLKAINGVLHVMDDVIPSVPYTIADFISQQSYLSTLNAALEASGLNAAVADPEADLTVFAPLNYAFDRLPDGTVETLLQDPTGDLTQILLYHVVGESLSADELVDQGRATTLQGAEVEVVSRQFRLPWWWKNTFSIVRINDARVIAADIETDNGRIHLISGVLLPPAQD